VTNLKEAGAASKKAPSRREYITLTPFQWWQIDTLEGIYAPTVPEVLKRIVLEWLEQNHDKIEQQKEAFREFEKTQSSQ
jgi:hypothetical protein